ncbi:MAG: class I tRNA ligase family protein, partial [Candidatus Aenigmatarchaeota archaeon]
LEYKDSDDPSIYVKFQTTEKKKYLLIWTTTPWTIVGNVAVMAHPTFKYVEFDTGEEILIFAKDCLDRVTKELGLSGTIVREFSGKELTKIKYYHPLANEVPIQNYEHKVVMSDEFVTVEEGTGLVHCAPGHGQEDFIIGKRYDLPIFSPITSDAKYSDEAGKYAGINILEANEIIMDELKRKGLLLLKSKITHRYPFCWRCKTKLIQIASVQWFIKITNLKDEMINENKKTIWIPEFGGIWFEDFVESARDWCISRQRYWGIPLPIWKCECGEILVIGSKKELEEKSGMKFKENELHRPYIDEAKINCKCGKKMERVKDIIDVWFDSGNAVWASLREGENYYPSDLIIEGKDQIRGWFYSLLGCGMIAKNSCPYKRVMMHGYVVDEKGIAMHKSLGNYVSLSEVLKKYDPDTIRLWCLSNVVWEDLKFSWKEMENYKKELNIIINIGNYLKRFADKTNEEDKSKMSEWLVSLRNSVIKEYIAHMENYNPHLALRLVRKFLVDDISRFYMKFIKGSGLKTLYDTFLIGLQLLSPFIPFTAEKIYLEVYKEKKGVDSIFLLEFPKVSEIEINKKLENYCRKSMEIIEIINSIRSSEKIPIRQPVDEVIVGTKSLEIKEVINLFVEEIKKITNVKNIRIDEETKVKLKETAKELGDVYEEILKLSDEELLSGKIKYGEKEIDFSKYLYVPIKDYASVITDFGFVSLKTKISEELIVERIVNEIRRRIQQMRKELNLIEKDEIKVYVKSENENIEKIVKENEKLLKDLVNAKEIKIETGGKLKKKWKILDADVELGILKV